jgi:hypothetical protein
MMLTDASTNRPSNENILGMACPNKWKHSLQTAVTVQTSHELPTSRKKNRMIDPNELHAIKSSPKL